MAKERVPKVRTLVTAPLPGPSGRGPQRQAAGALQQPGGEGTTAGDVGALALEAEHHDAASGVAAHAHVPEACPLLQRVPAGERQRQPRLLLVREAGDVGPDPALLQRAECLHTVLESPEHPALVAALSRPW